MSEEICIAKNTFEIDCSRVEQAQVEQGCGPRIADGRQRKGDECAPGVSTWPMRGLNAHLHLVPLHGQFVGKVGDEAQELPKKHESTLDGWMVEEYSPATLGPADDCNILRSQ